MSEVQAAVAVPQSSERDPKLLGFCAAAALVWTIIIATCLFKGEDWMFSQYRIPSDERTLAMNVVLSLASPGGALALTIGTFSCLLFAFYFRLTKFAVFILVMGVLAIPYGYMSIVLPLDRQAALDQNPR